MGPFSLEQLESLRDRGRLLPDHELSRDRKKWTAAARVSQLFPGQDGNATAVAPTTDGTLDDGQSEEINWYYAQGTEEIGPVAFVVLQRLAASGQLGADDLVWRTDYADWVTARTVAGLSFEQTNGMQARGQAIGSAAVRNYQRVASTGFWDSILRSVRQQITAEDLEKACLSLLRIGGYALMVSMLAGPGFLLVQAIKLDSIELGLLSLGAFFGLAVLKYVAQRMSLAAHEVVSASPNRLSSTAFPDSLAVTLLFLAILLAGLFTLWGIQQERGSQTVAYIVIGGQLLITLGYAACTALHTDWLNIDCSQRVKAGEEGIGIISLMLKIWLRFVPINFGIGAIIGTVGLTISIILLIVGGERTFEALEYAFKSGVLLLVVGLMPVLAYLMMTLWSILLDLVQSVLILPEKLDQLRPSEPVQVDNSEV